jgi:hypothetical protein
MCARERLLNGQGRDLDTRDVAAKDFGLCPVHEHQDAVARAEAHAEVGAAPENIRDRAAAGNVACEPRDVGHGLFGANVRERALVGILKGTDLLDAAQALLELLDLAEDLVAGLLTGCFFLGDGELGELGVDFLRLGHVVEHAGEESTFLSGDLGCWGVVCDCAVTDGPHVLGALDNQVFVHGQTTSRVLLGGDLADQVLDQRSEGVSGSPDEQSVGNLLNLLLAVRASRLGLDVLVGHVLNHGLCADGNRLLLERLLGVVDELLGEHGQNVGQSLDKGDMEVVFDLWEPLLQIRVEEVLELASKLNTGRSTTNNHHVQQALLLLVGLVLEGGRLAAVHDACADTLGISDLLEEQAVFTYTRNAYLCVSCARL